MHAMHVEGGTASCFVTNEPSQQEKKESILGQKQSKLCNNNLGKQQQLSINHPPHSSLHNTRNIHNITMTAMFATLLAVLLVALLLEPSSAFSTTKILARTCHSRCSNVEQARVMTRPSLPTSLKVSAEDASLATNESEKEEEIIDYEVPEDAVINIKPKAMKRLRELRSKQKDPNAFMVLRMGVRNGGCSGLSYVMDFSTEEEIQEDDEIDEYAQEKLKCVVDAKSMLYLYGLELDYSEELIGGGFKFFNPNAEESCGCGSSFGV